MTDTWNVRCCDCRTLVRNDQAHEVKADTLSGRAWRCDPCGDAASSRVREVNLSSIPTREQS